jgi:hypothetical protein
MGISLVGTSMSFTVPRTPMSGSKKKSYPALLKPLARSMTGVPIPPAEMTTLGANA